MKRVLDPREQVPRGRQRPQDVALMTQVEVCRSIPVSVRTWRRWRTAGLVPAPVPNIPGWPRWRVSAIEAFKRGLHRSGGRVLFGSSLRRSA